MKTTVFCVTLISLLLLSLTNLIFIFDFSEPIFIRVYGADEGEDGGHQGEDGGHQGDHQGEDGDHQGEDVILSMVKVIIKSLQFCCGR